MSDMKQVAQLLMEEMERSNKFPAMNFGLKMGEDWPALVTELLENEKVRTKLFLNFMMSALTMQSDMVKTSAKNASEDLPRLSSVYEPGLGWLYWGIRIGRRLAEIEALQELAKS